MLCAYDAVMTSVNICVQKTFVCVTSQRWHYITTVALYYNGGSTTSALISGFELQNIHCYTII